MSAKAEEDPKDDSVIEHMPCIFETLDSTFGNGKKEKKREGEREEK